MGDHRVTLTIIVEMHDKKRSIDSAWINYSERIGDEYGEWIQDQCDELRADQISRWFEQDFEDEKKKAEKEEFELYKKLKEKYEKPQKQED